MRRGRAWREGNNALWEDSAFSKLQMTPEERERRKAELIEQIKAEKDLTRYADLIDELIRFLRDPEPPTEANSQPQ